MRHRTVILAVLIACALCVAGAFAQQADGGDLRVKTSVDRCVLTVGDVIDYRMELDWATGLTPLPLDLGANLGRFEIRDYEAGTPETLKNGRTRRVTRYEIAVYETGEFTIPGLPVTYTLADGTQRTVNSEAIDLVVESVGADLAGSIRDIKPPAKIPIDRTLYYLIGGIALALAIIAIVGYILYRRYQLARLRERLFAPREPAHEIALRRLQELQARGEPGEETRKEYYAELSEIVREYLEGRFWLPALERTTDEILAESAPLPIPSAQREPLGELLSVTDLVKFARHAPDAGVREGLLEKARAFVDETKLRIVAAPAPETKPATGEEAA